MYRGKLVTTDSSAMLPSEEQSMTSGLVKGTFVLLALWVGLMVASITSAPAHGAIFGYDNFWDCILDKMPGVQNDVAAIAVVQICNEKELSQNVDKKKTNQTRQECTLKHSRNTSGERGPWMIRAACFNLYAG